MIYASLVQNSSILQHLDPFLSVYLEPRKMTHCLFIHYESTPNFVTMFSLLAQKNHSEDTHLYVYLIMGGLSGTDIMVKYVLCRI